MQNKTLKDMITKGEDKMRLNIWNWLGFNRYDSSSIPAFEAIRMMYMDGRRDSVGLMVYRVADGFHFSRFEAWLLPVYTK